jgi:hypothetical protein
MVGREPFSVVLITTHERKSTTGYISAEKKSLHARAICRPATVNDVPQPGNRYKHTNKITNTYTTGGYVRFDMACNLRSSSRLTPVFGSPFTPTRRAGSGAGALPEASRPHIWEAVTWTPSERVLERTLTRA